jgi:hypothetical protein
MCLGSLWDYLLLNEGGREGVMQRVQAVYVSLVCIAAVMLWCAMDQGGSKKVNKQ